MWSSGSIAVILCGGVQVGQVEDILVPYRNVRPNSGMDLEYLINFSVRMGFDVPGHCLIIKSFGV